jgi:hypothetical protein
MPRGLRRTTSGPETVPDSSTESARNSRTTALELAHTRTSIQMPSFIAPLRPAPDLPPGDGPARQRRGAPPHPADAAP